MDRKEKLKQRTKQFFIEAAKEIILDEGLENLTSKKIAHNAGYASGTLYNYFESVDILLYQCALDFLDEPIKMVEKRGFSSENTEEKIIELFEVFSRFFLDNPNIIELTFYKSFGDIPKSVDRKPLINSKSFELMTEFGIENNRKKSELVLFGNVLTKNIIGGIILFSYNSYALEDKEDFIKDQNENIKFILHAKTQNNDLEFYDSIYNDLIDTTL